VGNDESTTEVFYVYTAHFLLVESMCYLKYSIALLILVITPCITTTFAQVPRFEEQWTAPPPPAGYASWYALASAYRLSATGPIVIGGVDYSTAITDRQGQKKDVFYYDDQPLYCEISCPAGSVLNWVVGIVEYYPPTYSYSNYLPSSAQYIGTAGSTTKMGPFARGSSDPEGKYAWKIGLMTLIGSRWYWATTIQHFDFRKEEITTTTPTDTTTTTKNLKLLVSPTTIKEGEQTPVTISVNGLSAGDTASVTLSGPGLSQTLTVAGTPMTAPITPTGGGTISIFASATGYSSDISSIVVMPKSDQSWLLVILVSAIGIIAVVSIWRFTRPKPTVSRVPTMSLPPTTAYMPTKPMKPGTVHRPQVVEVRKKGQE